MSEEYDHLPIAIALVEELTAVWQETLTDLEIRNSVPRIHILKRAVREIPDFASLISNRVRDLYQAVFLQDVENLT